MNLHWGTYCSNILRVQPNNFTPLYSLSAEAASLACGSAGKNESASTQRLLDFWFSPQTVAL